MNDFAGRNTLPDVSQPVGRRLPFRGFTSPGVHWVWLSMILYAIACFLPAMGGFLGGAPVSGWECLVSFIYFIPAWWANPAYFVSLILCWCRRRCAATCFAVAAAVLACSFELMEVNNRGWMAALGEQEIGCYVWITSIQILACNLVWQEWLARRERRAQLEIGELTVEELRGIGFQPVNLA